MQHRDAQDADAHQGEGRPYDPKESSAQKLGNGGQSRFAQNLRCSGLFGDSIQLGQMEDGPKKLLQ